MGAKEMYEKVCCTCRTVRSPAAVREMSPLSSLQRQMSPFNALSGEEQGERLYSQAGFLESSGNFSDPESRFTFAVFTFKIEVLIVFKIIQ